MSEHDRDVEPAEVLQHRLGLSRRRFLGAATTGVAAAAAISATAPFASAAPAAPKGALVSPAKRGIILYTVRDATGRDPQSTNLPSGFREVFKELGKIGYRQVEFAGYNQHANAPGGANLGTVEGARMLRRWLDDNGLVAQGNHGFIPSSWPLSVADRDEFKRQLEIANIIGMDHMGTGGDPSGSRYKDDWDVAADKWNAMGTIATGAGLKLYTHNHHEAYDFLLDRGPLDDQGRPTRSSGIRRLEYFLKISDPKVVWLEMDIYWAHVAQYRYKTYTAPDGSTQNDVFNPLKTVQKQTKRFPLFHAKDGDSDTSSADGYDMVPFGEGDIDYQKFFKNMGARNYHNPMYEQDNAPGDAAHPNQSLEFAAESYAAMARLRA
ncbi:MAG: TIM barrel protein [Actinophytocola sp.]|uniref:sugar phosphate isomerase/epimerase family protein n=1 Tax=Actinophytocola sp. TaxID=1872138 RepID=UPI00132430C4|nr:TIM barrel protein [Actinophytocola sp.]MPZ85446.1 TIM barrel protein [Actinophytocola sp.]